jgi:hypothetical protein
MRISASVMAHPNRVEHVRELMESLDRPVPIHWDDEGPPSGSGDRVWRTARGAWSLSDPAADYHVLLQDDAIVSADFLAGIEQMLDHVPAGAVVSPYLGTGRMAAPRWDVLCRTATDRGASFIRSGQVLWGVCLAVPVADLPAMLDWCDRRAGVPDDMRVAGWAKREGREVWYPWPSLADHRTSVSLTKHRALDRVARRHHTGSALDLSWSGPVVSDPMLVRRASPRSGPSSYRRVTSPTMADKPRKAGKRA